MRRTAIHGVLAMMAATAISQPAYPQASFNLAGDSAAVRVTSLRDMPFKTVVRQQYDYSCGSAALATLLTHHYGRNVREAEIFAAMFRVGDQAKIRKVGFSLLDMKRYLESTGLKANGYRWNLEELARAKAPSIALIKVGAYRHFVVVKGVRDGQVLVGDPSQGLKRYRLREFQQVWNGVVFVVDQPGGRAGYDRADEWGHFAMGPMQPLDDSSLASFTRDLPPIFQVVALSNGRGTIQ